MDSLADASESVSYQSLSAPNHQPVPSGTGDLDGSYWMCVCVWLLTPAEGRKHPQVKRAKSHSDLFSHEDPCGEPHKHRRVKHARRRNRGLKASVGSQIERVCVCVCQRGSLEYYEREEEDFSFFCQSTQQREGSKLCTFLGRGCLLCR